MIGIRAGIGCGIGAGIAAGSGADALPPPALPGVSRDAIRGVYVPASAAQWNTVLAAAGIASGGPSAVYLFQEASGNLADSVGTFTQVNGSAAPTYQAAVSGWSRRSVQTVDGGTTSFQNTAAGLPDISTTSCAVLTYAANATAGSVRAIATLGVTGAFLVNASSATGRVSLRMSVGGVQDGALALGTMVRPHFLVLDRTAAELRLSTDAETVTRAIGTVSGKQLTYGSAANSVGANNYLYSAVFFGAAAELTLAQQRRVLATLGWSVTW